MTMNQMIQRRRKALRLTQEQVAEYLGVSTPAVNKWERGTTCPDISILPALARLLDIDMNTLFCFREDLSEQEIACFLNELGLYLKENGKNPGKISTVFLKAEEKIKEYPNCEALLYSVTLFLEGTLTMYVMEEEEEAIYKDKILAWYEHCTKSCDEKIKNGAMFMLANKYLAKEELDKAQKLVDQLPERSAMNKQLFQADIYLQRNEPKEAAKVMQRALLSEVNEIQGILLRLIHIESEAKEWDVARQIANKAAEATALFDLWDYLAAVPLLEVALDEQNETESIALIKQLLSAILEPWNMSDSPLYRYIATAPEKASEAVGGQIFPRLLEELKRDSRYDFLRENTEFQEMLAFYNKENRFL